MFCNDFPVDKGFRLNVYTILSGYTHHSNISDVLIFKYPLFTTNCINPLISRGQKTNQVCLHLRSDIRSICFENLANSISCLLSICTIIYQLKLQRPYIRPKGNRSFITLFCTNAPMFKVLNQHAIAMNQTTERPNTQVISRLLRVIQGTLRIRSVIKSSIFLTNQGTLTIIISTIIIFFTKSIVTRLDHSKVDQLVKHSDHVILIPSHLILSKV